MSRAAGVAGAVPAASPPIAPSPDRRAFLKAVAASPLAVFAGCRQPGSPVLVVGAGLTGLVVARALRRQGRAVLVLEASTRAGGRIKTIRRGLSPGLRGEAGAERVPRSHVRVRALLRELGIGLGPGIQTAPPFAIEIDGRTHWVDDLGQLPDTVFAGLTPFERQAAPFELHLAYADAADPPAPDDPRGALPWLRDLGLSKRGEELLAGFCYHPLSVMAAAELWAAARREREAWDAELIGGGSDRLTAALAADLVVRHDARVAGVAQGPDRVAVTLAGGEVVQGAACVLCVPVGMLRVLGVDDDLTRRLTARLAGLVEVREVKVHAAVDDAALQRRAAAAFAYAAGPPQRVSWRMPERAAGRSVITTMGFDTDLGSLASANVSTVPGVPVVGHDFCADPLAGAAYVVARPGFVRQAGPIRAGRIVVAGADLSDQPGWMEGAVGAAEQAVQAVLRLPR